MKLLRGFRRKNKHSQDAAIKDSDGKELRKLIDSAAMEAIEEQPEVESRMIEEADGREEEAARSEEREDIRESPRENKSWKHKTKAAPNEGSESRFLDLACDRGIDIGRCHDVVNEKHILEFKKTAKQTQREIRSDGPFEFMCGTLETACGLESQQVQQVPKSAKKKAFRMFTIVKDSPKDKVGLSFVAFKDREGIYVCKIKEGSKFLETGLKVGMRVAYLNGQPCPARVGQLMKHLKATQDTVEIVVEKEPAEDQDVQDEKSTVAGSTIAGSTIADDSGSTVYDENSSWSGDSKDTYSTEGSLTYQRMEKDGHVAVMMDMLLGQHKERTQKRGKKDDNFRNNVSYIVGNMKKGAPLWMFLE